MTNNEILYVMDNKNTKFRTPTIKEITKDQIELQEEWLSQTTIEFESIFGAQPLLMELLRVRLMTLPGYQYAGTTQSLS